jgi:hypothetical protein
MNLTEAIAYREEKFAEAEKLAARIEKPSRGTAVKALFSDFEALMAEIEDLDRRIADGAQRRSSGRRPVGTNLFGMGYRPIITVYRGRGR